MWVSWSQPKPNQCKWVCYSVKSTIPKHMENIVVQTAHHVNDLIT